ncbi:MAG: hypothetical protein WEE64_13000 [Dehalococcoidia bacterium]
MEEKVADGAPVEQNSEERAHGLFIGAVRDGLKGGDPLLRSVTGLLWARAHERTANLAVR